MDHRFGHRRSLAALKASWDAIHHRSLTNWTRAMSLITFRGNINCAIFHRVNFTDFYALQKASFDHGAMHELHFEAEFDSVNVTQLHHHWQHSRHLLRIGILQRLVDGGPPDAFSYKQANRHGQNFNAISGKLRQHFGILHVTPIPPQHTSPPTRYGLASVVFRSTLSRTKKLCRLIRELWLTENFVAIERASNGKLR